MRARRRSIPEGEGRMARAYQRHAGAQHALGAQPIADVIGQRDDAIGAPDQGTVEAEQEREGVARVRIGVMHHDGQRDRGPAE